MFVALINIAGIPIRKSSISNRLDFILLEGMAFDLVHFRRDETKQASLYTLNTKRQDDRVGFIVCRELLVLHTQARVRLRNANKIY